MAQRPRGTRDFGPAEMAGRNHLALVLRDTFARYAYTEVQTPTFEELELFTAKSGEGIISELYDFEDKGGRRLALRPELTAPVMRMYFQEHAFDAKPIKWFYFQSCFRYDRPQAGRYREFWQFGCEQIGAGTPLAYAELIALADACLRTAGLQRFRLGVGHVGVLRHAVDAFAFDASTRAAFMRAIDKGDRAEMAKIAAAKGGGNAALDRLLLVMDATDAPAAKTAMQGAADAEAELVELEQTLAALGHLGVPVRLDLGIARGLDYYNGIVFEAHADALGAQSQVLGGGGYDLSAVFEGQPTPTMGFGLGFDRLLVALEQEGNILPAPLAPEVAFASLSDGALSHVLAWASALRQSGVRVDVDAMGRKPSAVAKWADSLGAKYLVMVGDRDLESAKVSIKQLSDGVAYEVSMGELVSWFGRHRT